VDKNITQACTQSFTKGWWNLPGNGDSAGLKPRQRYPKEENPYVQITCAPSAKTILQKAQVTKPLCDEPYSTICPPIHLLFTSERPMGTPC